MVEQKRTATDGWVARESGEWAKEKLYYLNRYFDAFIQATKKSFDRQVYVDLLAGPGRCYLKDNPADEFEGSPILALTGKAPFSSVLCVEGDAKNAEALKHRIGGCPRESTAAVLHGNANAPETIARVREALSGRTTLGLIFVDTLGLSDVAFRTLQEITRGRAGTVDVADALTAVFEQQLRKGLGYSHVESLHRLMKNSKNAPLYRLILASHDDLAPKL